MPWKTTDVSGFTKAATTDALKKKWVAVANDVLARCLDGGGTQAGCEASAIKQANGIVKEDDMGEVTVTVAVPTVAENASITGTIPELPPGTLINDIVPAEGADEVLDTATDTAEEAEPIEEAPEEVEEVGKRLNAKQVKNLTAALDTIKGLLGWANYDDLIPEEPVEEKFAESASGRVVGLAEAKPVLPDSVVPLHLDAVLIEPGWGNDHDNHYYPREMLEEYADVFEGAKMFETDHRPGEKSTRTWVSTVKGIEGFTGDGAPIARLSVHVRDFAERLLALDADELLGKMECSILAGGTAKKGEVDGKKGRIVESITEVDSVDWVTRAGAGGRALALTESEEGSMEDEQEVQEETEEIEEVAISEDSEPEAPAPEPLSDERVAERLGETNLPKASQKRLSVEYADEESLEAAVVAEIAYVKELTGSGEPFGMDGGPQSQEPLTEEEKTARFNRRMRAVGGREV